MIIDCHAHVASLFSIPQVFFDGWCETMGSNMPRKLTMRELDLLKSRMSHLQSDEQCDAMVQEMDAAGITQSVLLIIDFSHHFGELAADLKELHAYHRAIAARHPGRFLLFAGADPRNGREGVELFETSIKEHGFRGLKLYPPCGYSPSDPALDPYYALCEQYRIPVLTHIGPTTSRMPFSHTEPRDVDRAAYRFSKVNFILGHAGAKHYREAALLAEYRPNVFLDISGFQTELRRGSFDEIARFHKSRGISRKLLFGTDWPVHRLDGRQVQWVEAVRDLARRSILTVADTNGLFFENFMRLYE
ncbi:MAG TPA: amidohydrolase family protein [Polyangiales bacterium]